MIEPAYARRMDDPEIALLNNLIREIRRAISETGCADQLVADDAKHDIAISALLNVAAFAIYQCCGSRGHIVEAQRLLGTAWEQYASESKEIH